MLLSKVIIAGIGAAGLYLAGGRKKTPVQAKVEEAVQSGDRQTILAAAAELKVEAPAAADDLTKLAAEITVLAESNQPLPPAPIITIVNPVPPTEPVETETSKAASALVLHLSTPRRPGTEDRLLVSRYQKAVEPAAGKVDGLYGPKTAASLIALGYVPPTPLYWPRTNRTAAKSAYKSLLLEQSKQDGPRSEEWLAAAGMVK